MDGGRTFTLHKDDGWVLFDPDTKDSQRFDKLSNAINASINMLDTRDRQGRVVIDVGSLPILVAEKRPDESGSWNFKIQEKWSAVAQVAEELIESNLL